jgi:hypothetical protein
MCHGLQPICCSHVMLLLTEVYGPVPLLTVVMCCCHLASLLAAWCQGTVMPDSNESFMDGNLGLGMAIPEEATAALGPLPSLMGSNRTERDEVCQPASSTVCVTLSGGICISCPACSIAPTPATLPASPCAWR